jgi:hypothetical protein
VATTTTTSSTVIGPSSLHAKAAAAGDAPGNTSADAVSIGNNSIYNTSNNNNNNNNNEEKDSKEKVENGAVRTDSTRDQQRKEVDTNYGGSLVDLVVDGCSKLRTRGRSLIIASDNHIDPRVRDTSDNNTAAAAVDVAADLADAEGIALAWLPTTDNGFSTPTSESSSKKNANASDYYSNNNNYNNGTAATTGQHHHHHQQAARSGGHENIPPAAIKIVFRVGGGSFNGAVKMLSVCGG